MIAVTRNLKRGPKLAAPVEQRDFVVTGLVFLVLMQVAFLSSSPERGATYAAIQTVGLVAAIVALWGVRQGGSTPQWALASGLGLLAIIRILQTVLGISRLPLTMQYALFGSLALASASVALNWSITKATFWVLAGVYFAGSVFALTGGSLPGLLGLAAGMIGFSLIAPNWTTEHAPQNAARPAASE